MYSKAITVTINSAIGIASQTPVKPICNDATKNAIFQMTGITVIKSIPIVLFVTVKCFDLLHFLIGQFKSEKVKVFLYVIGIA